MPSQNEAASPARARFVPSAVSDWASTKRVPGRVLFSGGGSLLGDLHLQANGATRSSAETETPLELLNRREAFFPLTLPGEVVRLISKARVTAVILGPEAPAPKHLPVTRPVDFEVYMADGSEYRGDVYIELRPPRIRALDLLNVPEEFFVMEAPGQMVYLNRSHIEYVVPGDSVPSSC